MFMVRPSAFHEPERRSPTRLVSVHGPNARPFGAVGATHKHGNAAGAVGARFVPNRSADVGTGAEPTQTRGLAERCEPNLGLAMGQLAFRRQGRFRGSMCESFGEISPRPSSIRTGACIRAGRHQIPDPQRQRREIVVENRLQNNFQPRPGRPHREIIRLVLPSKKNESAHQFARPLPDRGSFLALEQPSFGVSGSGSKIDKFRLRVMIWFVGRWPVPVRLDAGVVQW